VADDAVAREIAQLRADMHDDFETVNESLGRMLPRELYMEKHERLRAEVAALKAEFERRVAALEQARVEDQRKRERERDAQAADRERNQGEWRRTKWIGILGFVGAILASIIAPIITVVVNK
jgi:hypothetical protein